MRDDPRLTESISSRVLLLVSGTRKNVNTHDTAEKTAKKIKAPSCVFFTRGGVISPMIKLLNQLDTTEIATPLERRELENISEGIAQGTGPHVRPKMII
jgi:hypothetical protein